MPGWLGLDAKPIVEGWGPPPQLHAAPIGDLVSSILKNRLANQELAQKSVADAIKQYRQDQAANAYLEQARAAGVLPEGELSGQYGGAYGKTLADQIREKGEAESLAGYRTALGERIASGGGRGGGSGGGGRAAPPGKEWVQDDNGDWHLVTGNAALRAAQGPAANPYEERFKTVTTPGAVTYWNKDYSKRISTEEAEADPAAVAVMPNKVPMPYGVYKKVAGEVVKKYYTGKTAPAPDQEPALPQDGATPPPTTQAAPAPTPPPSLPGGGADKNTAQGYGVTGVKVGETRIVNDKTYVWDGTRWNPQ